MDRRRYLQAVGTAILGGIAGCGGGDSGGGNNGGGNNGGGNNGGGNKSPTADTPSPTPKMTQVNVSTADISPPNPDFTLKVRWNARTVQNIQLEDGGKITPRGNGKIVVIAFEVTTPPDQSVALRPNMWRLGAVGFQYKPLEASRTYFPKTTAEPKSTISGWLAYSIPRSVFNAQFLLTQSQTEATINVKFTKDEDLKIPPL